MENEADMMRLVDQARNILQSVYRALAYEPQYRLAASMIRAIMPHAPSAAK